MSGVAYFSVDAFGVPGRVLGLSDEFYGALGRVAALGALVELRMSDVVVLWGRDQSDTGKLMKQLTDRFKAIRNERLKAGKHVPDGLAKAVAAAVAVMLERNELLRSLWPGEEKGWRNRSTGSVPTKYIGLSDVTAVIARLVDAVDGFRPYLSSPID
jgi:hypothetical protein